MWIVIVPLAIALASAIIGVFGKSWDEDKAGWRRLTLKGWLVIIVSVVSFSAASIQAIDAYKLGQDAKKREQLLGAMARGDVYDALNTLLGPLKLVLDERGGVLFNDPINQHMYSPMARVEMFETDAFADILRPVAKVHTCDSPDA